MAQLAEAPINLQTSLKSADGSARVAALACACLGEAATIFEGGQFTAASAAQVVPDIADAEAIAEVLTACATANMRSERRIAGRAEPCTVPADSVSDDPL